MTKTLKAFNVTARMIIVADISIKAASLEEAVAEAATLKEVDFISFKGEFDDGSIKIVGVNATRAWDTEQE